LKLWPCTLPYLSSKFIAIYNFKGCINLAYTNPEKLKRDELQNKKEELKKQYEENKKNNQQLDDEEENEKNEIFNTRTNGRI